MKPATFRSLHAPGELLVLPNAWDAGSARLIERAGAAAIATSSAAMSWAHGLRDGERLAADTVVATVREIIRAVDVPVSVDLELGYGDPADTIAPLLDAGIAGINLEDGAGPPELLARKLDGVRRTAARAGVDLFVNARTDVYLKGLVASERRVDETIARGGRYRDAGADGLFVPRVVAPAEIEAIAKAIDLPLNALAVPGIAPPPELRRLGVRRLSVGQAIAQVAWAAARRATRALLEAGRYDAMFEDAIPFAEMNELFAP